MKLKYLSLQYAYNNVINIQKVKNFVMFEKICNESKYFNKVILNHHVKKKNSLCVYL